MGRSVSYNILKVMNYNTNILRHQEVCSPLFIIKLAIKRHSGHNNFAPHGERNLATQVIEAILLLPYWRSAGERFPKL
jgi:hypothetical protein